ncbi:MAG: glycoside hydrolase family 88 protein [Candidatus Azobacteroides sp.]|nr:glycoside hydrolase family 88 protein [Candidatus Azobacteroides sp.]
MKISICFYISVLILSGIINYSCIDKKEKFIKENTEFAAAQTHLMLEQLGEPDGKNYPRTTDEEGELVTTDMYEWTPGFFPGNLWYLYELTQEDYWRKQAEKWTESLEPLKTFTGHHDLGFMMYCSYGNASKLAPKPEYEAILVESAESLSSRYNETTQSIKSWNYRKSWNGQVECFFPVIVDNMMNLEMLFAASKISGNKKYYDIAVKHANSTIKNHLRDDFSSFHVVDYDTITGNVNIRMTSQGYSDNSTWSRGQAWIVYGFTMMYRETKDPVYLDVAVKSADYFIRNLPDDLIAPWDFNVGQEGYAAEGNSYAVQYNEKLKDASAAAIMCSALFELGKYAERKNYTEQAVNMLTELASPAYRAKLGENGNFILMHSVGSLPHKTEIDKPLVYADYYFLEALVRYKEMRENR